MSTINIDLTGETLYSGNGQLDSNRTVDCNSNTILFDNNSVFVVTSNVAPSGLNGAWTVNGFGSGSQRVEKITSSAGTIRESFGDKSQQFYGSTGINTIPNGNGWVMVDSTSAGIAGIFVSGTTVTGVRADIPSGSAFVGNGQIGVNVNGSYAGVYTTSSGGGFGIYSNARAYIETYGTGGSADNSAVLHLESTTQGFLPPRMTETERDTNITTPANGLIIYNITTGKHQGYNGSWNDLY